MSIEYIEYKRARTKTLSTRQLGFKILPATQLAANQDTSLLPNLNPLDHWYGTVLGSYGDLAFMVVGAIHAHHHKSRVLIRVVEPIILLVRT